MLSTTPYRAHDEIAASLLDLLHRSATAEAFSAQLARVEALPDSVKEKAGMLELVRMSMALRNRMELHEQRERGMLAVIESAQDLSSRLDLQGLLKAIVNRARNLMGSPLCWLSVADAETGEFQVVVTDGAISQRTGRMTATRSLGVAGVVMASRLPFSTPDYLSDTRFVHDTALDDTFRDEGIAALVGVPLISEDEVIGLLFVADRYHRTHTALHVSILCTLATHAAVAINNAKAFAEARTALTNADLARTELEMRARDIQGAAEAHEQLTSLLASGASLGALCDSVARQLEGHVLVLDEAGQLIGSASPGDTASAAAASYSPTGDHSAPLTQALRESRVAGRSVLAYETGGERCRAIAVIGGNDILGAVLIFRRDDLAGIALRTFERSASVIGLVLLSQERVEAQKYRDTSALIRTLISPRQGERSVDRNRADTLGLNLSQPVCMVVVETDSSMATPCSRRLRADPLLRGELQDEVDGVVVLLCPASRSADVLDNFGAFARRELGPDYRGVVSRPAASPAELPSVYATLRRALPVLARLGMQGRVVAQNEIALYSVLFESQDRSSLVAYLDSIVGAVIAHDAKRGSDLMATLLVYFDSNQNATVTATRIGIHVNTVRQRLATAEDYLGHWGNASRALELHMALRLWKLGLEGCGDGPVANDPRRR